MSVKYLVGDSEFCKSVVDVTQSQVQGILSVLPAVCRAWPAPVLSYQ